MTTSTDFPLQVIVAAITTTGAVMVAAGGWFAGRRQAATSADVAESAEYRAWNKSLREEIEGERTERRRVEAECKATIGEMERQIQGLSERLRAMERAAPTPPQKRRPGGGGVGSD